MYITSQRLTLPAWSHLRGSQVRQHVAACMPWRNCLHVECINTARVARPFPLAISRGGSKRMKPVESCRFKCQHLIHAFTTVQRRLDEQAASYGERIEGGGPDRFHLEREA